MSDFLKYMHFGVKIQFSGILNFLRIFGSDLVGAIGFLEAVHMDKLLILSKKDFKGHMKAKNISKFESITHSVEQMENIFADP